MRREPVTTDGAPKALGPYTQAIRSSGETLVFCSGQVGLDPASGNLVAGDITAQTRQALRNLGAVLDAAGTSLAFVVKTTVFLADMNDFAAMNAIYGEFFPAPYPARSTVQVARLPKDALVEIEAIAIGTATSRDA
jgi:2-iminobutanoate/2-iminopropanoate deaminase